MQDTTSQGNFLYHTNCDKCGSSDANAVYDNETTYCFACGGYSREQIKETRMTKHDKTLLQGGSSKALPARKLSDESLRKFGVTINYHQGKPVIVFPYYNKRGDIVAQKIRDENKNFSCLGDMKEAVLFGQNLWSSGRRIIITEGEFDAIAMSQVQGHKWAVVSVPNGASGAKKALEKNLRWLEDNFEEIVLMFDNDDAGREAAAECCPLFSPHKIRVATLPMKDANEMVLNGKIQELITASWAAKEYRPDGVLNFKDIVPLLGKTPEFGLTLPFESIFKWTYGIKGSQIWLWTSGSGMGKTEFLKKTAVHLALKHKTKVGIIFLEEEVTETAESLAGDYVGKCFNSPDIPFDPREKEEALDKIVEDDLFCIYDHRGNFSFDNIKSVIRFMVVSEGCKVVFLDHLTVFTDGLPAGEANAVAEKMMKDLTAMTRELDFNLQTVAHIRKTDSKTKQSAEEGGRVKLDDLKGSGAIKQWSNIIIALERNQQETDPVKKNTTRLRILKARGAGKNVGNVCGVYYDPKDSSLKEVELKQCDITIEDDDDAVFS